MRIGQRPGARSHSQHLCGSGRFACTSPRRPGLAPASGVLRACFTALVNSQSILSKTGCDAGEGTRRQWFNLNLNVPNYRFCLMLYFLPKDLDGNQRIERKISCHLQDRLSLSLHSQEIFIPNLSELVLFLC